MAALLLSVGGATAATGCGQCNLDCGAPEQILENATLVERTDDIARFALDDGTTVDVQVSGPIDELDEGRAYRVPLYEDPTSGGPPNAGFGDEDDCDCVADITHANGSEIDTSLLPDVTLESVAWITLGGFAAIVIVWGTARRLLARRA